MVPFLNIHSVKAKIGAETERPQYDIRSPQPEMQVHSSPAVITADNGPGLLRIDQRRTDNALTGGRPDAFWPQVYGQYRQVAMQNLQQIVEKGNTIGDLRIKQNPVADMALSEFMEGAPDLQIYGEATPRNIDIEYIPNDLNLQVTTGSVEIDVQTHRPEVNFQRGSVRIYMQQYPQLTITPPVINTIA